MGGEGGDGGGDGGDLQTSMEAGSRRRSSYKEERQGAENASVYDSCSTNSSSPNTLI